MIQAQGGQPEKAVPIPLRRAFQRSAPGRRLADGRAPGGLSSAGESAKGTQELSKTEVSCQRVSEGQIEKQWKWSWESRRPLSCRIWRMRALEVDAKMVEDELSFMPGTLTKLQQW